jgi:hypothetical protein
MRKLVLLAFIFTGLVSCGGFSMKSLRPTEELLPTDGYLFGEFFSMGMNEMNDEPGSYFGFEFKNYTTGQVFGLRFSENLKDGLLVIPVNAGEYDFGKMWYLYKNGNKYEGKPMDSEKFTVEPGKLYYLGKWAGMHKYWTTGNMYHHNWNLVNLVDKFEECLEKLQDKYGNLSGMEAKDVLPNLELYQKLQEAGKK